MPAGDGTGPWGSGNRGCRRRSAAGRGRQYAGGGRVRRNGSWLVGILVPLVVAVIRELRSPSGLHNATTVRISEKYGNTGNADRLPLKKVKRIVSRIQEDV